MGELLIDLIGIKEAKNLEKSQDFRKVLGGSVANVALNLKKLGCNAALVATIGNDGLGTFILSEKKRLGMTTDYIEVHGKLPTSVILVSKTQDTPDFIPYRAADSEIYYDQVSDDVVRKASIFHTTCFALSKEPACSSILSKAQVAFESNSILSIDLNYSNKVWSEKNKAIKTVEKYCEYRPFVKISDDDKQRLFGSDFSDEELFETLHRYGAKCICLTKGSQGVKISQIDKTILSKPASPIETVVDATGAGDAFWAGFLCALLDGKAIEQSVEFALKVARIKLSSLGGLPRDIMNKI